MSLRISMGLLSIQVRADNKDWTACSATPRRACVLDVLFT